MTSQQLFCLFLFLGDVGLPRTVGLPAGSNISEPKHSKTLPLEDLYMSLQEDIVQDLSHLSLRKQREILKGLEEQEKEFGGISSKGLLLVEQEAPSPLNVDDLKNVQKTIKNANATLPVIRNKRTLNFLLRAVAAAMGYNLTPRNIDAEWIPRQRPPASSANPCSPTPPPCTSSPATPPPCAPPSPPSPSPCRPPSPPTAPPCTSAPPACSHALVQPATIPPDQIDANTISYPYRPARAIPLLEFAPLPQGVNVPYPALQERPAQGPCNPPQTPPPCGAPPTPRGPPPCTTPIPLPRPCATTPAPPSPCGTTPSPCGRAPPPSTPPPCRVPPPSTLPPCTTPAPKMPPCPPPLPSCPTPPQKKPPCPPPPSASPSPPPSCGNPHPKTPSCDGSPSHGHPPSQSPPQSKPKKGSILLEYDDPLRIQIFSSDKKFLPASGQTYKGHNDGYEEFSHSYFYPSMEKEKENSEEDEEEQVEEHLESQEENDDNSSEKKEENQEQWTKEREKQDAEEEEEEEKESETNLSIVKKPLTSAKERNAPGAKRNAKEEMIAEEKIKSKVTKMKKPKRKKWVRIVKKQRRKMKTDSSPEETFDVYTSDGSAESLGRFRTVRGGSSSNPRVDSSQMETRNKMALERGMPESGSGRSERLARENDEEKRKRLEEAVERYVEDYIEKQLGEEILKNTGVPRTTVFDFAPGDGPRIRTITKTVAKTTGNPSPSLDVKYRGSGSRALRGSASSNTGRESGWTGKDDFPDFARK